jgi:hypothetical protein
MATIKITELTSIGANLTSSTVIPVVNMSGTPTTEKTLLGNIANVVLAGAGGNYTAAAVSILAQSVTNAAQPNITSVGTLTNIAVSGNATVNGNITSNGTAYVGNLSTTGLASITTLTVGATANLGAVGNITITGGTVGQVLSTDGNGVLSWASDATTYGNSNVAAYLPTYTGNIGGDVVTANLFSGNGINLTNIAGANVSGFVPNANVANTAFAVAAANVSGLGNIATINLDGNASNLLTGNGTYVAIPVVPAVGNIATINLDGNSSNVLRGDGTFGADANSSYGDSNVVSLLAAFGSNTIVTTGIITADGANLSNVPYANLTGAPTLGNIATLNLDGNASNLLTGNGTYVAIPVVPTVGNIATLNLDGSNSNVLYGNGVFAAVAGGGANTGNVTFNGNVISTSGTNDLLINLNGQDFIANTSNGGAIGLYSGNSQIAINNDTPGIEITSLNVNLVAIAEGGINLDATAANGVVDIESTGNTTIIANGNAWTFDNDGNLTLSGNTVAINFANGTAAFGNIVSVNLDGNASNVLLGNGVFASIPSPGELTANLDANTYSIANLGAIDFDTAANISVGQGQMAWNSSDGTLDIGLGYSNVVLQVGQETHYVVRNDSGNTILNGTAVYCSGVTTGSGRVEASPMTGSTDPVKFLGLATQNITDGVNGVVTYFGYVRGLDTRGTANTAISVGDETWAVGDQLYVHPTADGKLTNVEPEAPNVKICVASIMTRNETSGTVFVRPTTNLDLVDLSDVQIDTPANGEVLQYVSANSRWENTSISSIANGNSNVSIASSNGNVTIAAVGNTTMTVTGTGANVTGTLTSTGKIGYASGSTVTQTTNRGNGVTINALAGTIITTSASMVANQIDTFSVANDQVDPNNDIVLVQIVSPNFGVYNCIAQPSATISVSLTGFYINIVNISGFTTTSDAITIRFMVIKAPNA